MITLRLLDHHGTGKKSSEKYEWYFLDTSRSATQITYDYFCKNYTQFEEKCEENFPKLVQAINAADIWKEEDELFEFGKVCMSMITKSFEINHLLFPTQHRDYKHFLLTKALDFVNIENGYILLDEKIYYFKKEKNRRTHRRTLYSRRRDASDGDRQDPRFGHRHHSGQRVQGSGGADRTVRRRAHAAAEDGDCHQSKEKGQPGLQHHIPDHGFKKPL